MDTYIVWTSKFYDEVSWTGDDDIIGVFTDELRAYQVACVKQIELFNTHYKNDLTTHWLQDHTFPSSDDDLETWKKYFELVTDDETIEKVNDVDNLKECDFELVHVTKKTLDELPSMKSV
jgi:hypothetical protein